MATILRVPISGKLTHAGRYLVELLEANNKPVLSQFDFHRIVWRLYTEPSGRRLFLRTSTPSQNDTVRLRESLKDNGKLASDPDYGPHVLRVLSVPDLPADDIACLVDPTCYVSHLSAMQRWGLTDRHPENLILTRPDRTTMKRRLQERYDTIAANGEENPFASKVIAHPSVVRGRPLQLHETKATGGFVQDRSSATRLSSIGQTFLDMVQNPDLCGGMAHVLEVWDEHARTYLNEIVDAVNVAYTGVAKVRAGYILEERLGIRNARIESWKSFAQRGSSRKLDPEKAFAPEFSEAWMLSLNV